MNHNKPDNIIDKLLDNHERVSQMPISFHGEELPPYDFEYNKYMVDNYLSFANFCVSRLGTEIMNEEDKEYDNHLELIKRK